MSSSGARPWRTVGAVFAVLGGLGGAALGFGLGLLLTAAMCTSAGRPMELEDGTIDEGRPCSTAVPVLLLGGGAIGGLVLGSIPGGLLFVFAASSRTPTGTGPPRPPSPAN